MEKGQKNQNKASDMEKSRHNKYLLSHISANSKGGVALGVLAGDGVNVRDVDLMTRGYN